MAQSLLFKNGRIVDGTGGPSYHGDLLVEDGKIVEISRVPIAAEAEVIDCTGSVVAPGFIDLHSHMDFIAAGGKPGSGDNVRGFDSFTKQGITTFVGGNCGFSLFGFKPDGPYQALIDDGLFEDGPETIDWSGYPGFADRVKQNGVKHNIVSLAGHGTCRTSISGYEARKLTGAERQEMLAQLDRSMAEGAIGVSLGLQYKPGIFADFEELKAVAELVKKHDKLLTVHARAYSNFSGTYPMVPFGRDHNLKAIDDMIRLGRETGVRMQFSHLILVGSRTWGNVDEVIALFDAAIADGVDIKFDMFAYPCGATLLHTFVSEWFMAKMPASLSRGMDLMRLRAELAIGFIVVGFGFGDMQITQANCAEYGQYDGKFVPEIAKAVGKSDFATVIDILKCSNATARVLNHSYYGADVIERLMVHPAAIFATDAWSEPGGTRNPAAYGNFPRFLQLAREKGLLTVEEAVHKMTGAAAERVQMGTRGTLEVGKLADITVFDWEVVGAGATIEEDNAAPRGVEHVFVGGEPVLRDFQVL